MNSKNLKVAQDLVDPSFLRIAAGSLAARQKILTLLMSQGRIPEQPLDQLTIQYLLNSIALLDTNNFPNKIGVGEREARIFSSLVAKRNFRLGHGIGRSGDIGATQPKAAGSSLLKKITENLVKDAMMLAGLSNIKRVQFMPVATGMSILISLLALMKMRKGRKVIWCRIDQKSCLKAITSAGLQVVVVEGRAKDGVISVDPSEVQKAILKEGHQNVLGIISTTSCFAPRQPDDVQALAIIAKKHQVFHLVNNAYGVQTRNITANISKAMLQGQITVVVQSTDKNFMVPVGATVLFASDKKILKGISQCFPGRGSSGGIIDLFITLLQMGRSGWLRLLQTRQVQFKKTLESLQAFADKKGQRVIVNQHNTISIAMTLRTIESKASQLGSLLYSRYVMGHRVVTAKEPIEIEGLVFNNYGSHVEHFEELPYLTVASSIGQRESSVKELIERLESSWQQLNKKK